MAMRHISIHQNLLLIHVQHIQPLVPGRLAEITDRQYIGPVQPMMIQQIVISFEGIFKSLLRQPYLLQVELLIQIRYLFRKSRLLRTFGLDGVAPGPYDGYRQKKRYTYKPEKRFFCR